MTKTSSLSLALFIAAVAFPVIAAKPMSIAFQGKVNAGPNYGYGITCSNGITYDVVAWAGSNGDTYSPPPWDDSNPKYDNFNFSEYDGTCIDVFAYRLCETR
jgi:hypothetical protein